MPKKHYIVIILDVNSIPRESPNNDDSLEGGDAVDQIDENSPGQEGSNENLSTTPGSDGGTKQRKPRMPYKYGTVKSIKEMVISLLAKEALQYHGEKFDFSQVFWSIKLYNSSFEINSKTGRFFQPVGIESIEAFEKQLESFLDLESKSSIKSNPNINEIQFLSTSLKAVLGDLPWPEPNSDLHELAGNDNRNVIHAMFRVPGNETEFESFIPNWTAASASGSKSKIIMNELLPKAYFRKMRDHQIQMHFLDLWPAFRSGDSCEQLHDYATEKSTPMIKVAKFLEGMVTPFTQISQGVLLGMPSYADLLKLLIAENSQVPVEALSNSRSKSVLDETQKTIRKIEGSINGSIVNKVELFDDTDGDSIRSNGIRIPFPSYALAKHQRRSCPAMVNPYKMPVGVVDDRRWVEYDRPTAPADARRFSDGRDELYRRYRLPLPMEHDIPKKRKYAFEEDMESEEGYSPADIENWCQGKANAKEKHHQPMPMRRATAFADRGRRSASNLQHAKRPVPRYVSPQITQPRKRVRREKESEESIMAPPIRHRHSNEIATTTSKQRYSDPVATASFNKSGDDNKILALNALRTRGRVMVNEGLKKKTNKTRQKVATNEESPNRQCNFWKDNEKTLVEYKNHLQAMMKQHRKSAGLKEDPIDDLTKVVKWFVDMIVHEDQCCLPLVAQAVVTTVGAALVDLKVRDLREFMEKILFVPYEKLNLDVIRLKNTENEEAVFRKCFVQILINFEMVWTVPVNNMAAIEEQFLDDVTKILGLVRVYRKKPPLEDFVNGMLVPLYHPTHGRLLREITAALNIRPSAILNTSFESPRSNSGSGSRDDCSVSSFNSSMCGPEDSTSQHPNDNSFSQQSQQMNQSQNSLRTSLRTASFLSVNNPKRALMLQVSKLPTKPKMHQKSQSQSTQSGSLRPSAKSPKPKKVRRNLFDVQASRDPKDMKMLLNLATSNTSSFSRSPSLFKSPMSKHSCSPRSPGRPSPFFAAARARASKSKGRSSRRRLIMDPNDESPQDQRPASGVWGTMSNSPNESLLCPESPFTPKFKTVSLGSKSVIHESPEAIQPSNSGIGTGSKYRFGSRRIDSVSFYSIGTESLKSRAWERSGAKLLAARIRDSVDLSQSLSLSDLEFADDNGKEKNEDNQISNGSPVPCCSKSINISQRIEVNNINSVMSLITGEIKSSSTDILNSGANLPPTSKSPGLDTPTKRVQFSLGLVHTPSPTTPARSQCTGTPQTPKSILKDAGSIHT